METSEKAHGTRQGRGRGLLPWAGFIMLASGLLLAWWTQHPTLKDEGGSGGSEPFASPARGKAAANRNLEPGLREQAADLAEETVMGPRGRRRELHPTVFASGDRVTTATIEKLGLTEEQDRELQRVVRKVMTEAAKDFARRTVPVDTETGRTPVKFITRPREDGGQPYRDELTREFIRVAGPEKGQHLAEGLKTFVYAGALGKDSLEFFYAGNETMRGVSYEQSNGNFGYIMVEDFRNMVGESLTIPDEGQPIAVPLEDPEEGER